VLRESGVVTSTVAAKQRIYQLQRPALAQIQQWAERQLSFWDSRIEALHQHLRTDQEER
jgi:hypothetical protein